MFAAVWHRPDCRTAVTSNLPEADPPVTVDSVTAFPIRRPTTHREAWISPSSNRGRSVITG